MENQNKKGKTSQEKAIKKEKKEISISLVLPLILVLAVVGSVIGTIITSKFILPPPTVEVAPQTDSGQAKIDESQEIIPLEEFVVNLAKDGNTQQYIRVTLSLLVDSKKDSEEVEKNVALVRDSVVNLLRQKKASDILEAPEGFIEWKKELTDTINADYGKEIIQDVFITDSVIQ